jgi:hypothetical protein
VVPRASAIAAANEDLGSIRAAVTVYSASLVDVAPVEGTSVTVVRVRIALSPAPSTSCFATSRRGAARPKLTRHPGRKGLRRTLRRRAEEGR